MAFDDDGQAARAWHGARIDEVERDIVDLHEHDPGGGPVLVSDPELDPVGRGDEDAIARQTAVFHRQIVARIAVAGSDIPAGLAGA